MAHTVAVWIIFKGSNAEGDENRQKKFKNGTGKSNKKKTKWNENLSKWIEL
jgi:hypothetical protein